MNIQKTIEAMKTDKEMTYGETLEPAMEITDPEVANEYLKTMIERHMRLHGNTRDEAEKIAKANLGYYAGYYCDNGVTRKRVRRLFEASHPIFGDSAPTAAEAFHKGLKMGEAAQKK